MPKQPSKSTVYEQVFPEEYAALNEWQRFALTALDQFKQIANQGAVTAGKSGLVLTCPYKVIYDWFIEGNPSILSKLGVPMFILMAGEDNCQEGLKVEVSYETVGLFIAMMMPKFASPEEAANYFNDIIPNSPQARDEFLLVCSRVIQKVAPSISKLMRQHWHLVAPSRHSRKVREILALFNALAKGQAPPEKQKVKRKGRPTKDEVRRREAEHNRAHRQRMADLKSLKESIKGDTKRSRSK